MKNIFIYGNEEKLQNYKNAIIKSGAKPIFSTDTGVSNTCDALLLAGGYDVDPQFYGEKCAGSVKIDKTRDIDEINLINSFSKTDRPILGICRGIQIINVAFGGTLFQDIKTAKAHKWEEATRDKVHKIIADENSFLFQLYGKEFFVNSAHHQAIKDLAANAFISAKSEDDIVEAIEFTNKKILAVQFHPERMAFDKLRDDTVDGRAIFDLFLSYC